MKVHNQKRIAKINALIKAEIQRGCKACNNVGAYHCAHPEECVQWDNVLKLEKEREKLKINLPH